MYPNMIRLLPPALYLFFGIQTTEKLLLLSEEERPSEFRYQYQDIDRSMVFYSSKSV